MVLFWGNHYSLYKPLLYKEIFVLLQTKSGT